MPRKDFTVVRDTFANDSGLPFGRLLTRQYVLDTLESEGHEYRQRVFCPLVTLWAWLSQCLSQDKSQNEAVTRIIAHRVATGLPACSASSASYSNARVRFPMPVMQKMMLEIGRDIHATAPDDWHWHGRQVFLADGTGLSMPDTPENPGAFPQPKSQLPGVGFPIMRAVALISLATGAVVDFRCAQNSGKATGEGSLLRRMLDTLNCGDVVVADRLFLSYRTVAAVLERGIDMVACSHQRRLVDFSEGIILGNNDHIVEWTKPVQCSPTMSLDEFNRLPERIAIREFQIVIDGRDGQPELVTIISTITDPTIPQEEISGVYWTRWNCELDLRSIKQSMHMDILRCKSPEMVLKEIYCHLLAWNLLRGVMTESAKKAGIKPRQVSFKGTMQAVESFTPAMMVTATAGDALYDAFLTTVSARRVGNRPGRQEPRVKKRRQTWRTFMTKPRNQYHRKLAKAGRSKTRAG